MHVGRTHRGTGLCEFVRIDPDRDNIRYSTAALTPAATTTTTTTPPAATTPAA